LGFKISHTKEKRKEKLKINFPKTYSHEMVQKEKYYRKEEDNKTLNSHGNE